MSKLTDKVSYLKGLAAGMKLNMEKDSNKLLLEILGTMGDMAEEMQRTWQTRCSAKGTPRANTRR